MEHTQCLENLFEECIKSNPEGKDERNSSSLRESPGSDVNQEELGGVGNMYSHDLHTEAGENTLKCHINNKSYKCGTCKKSFSQKSKLSQHSCTDEKPFKCNVCSKSFVWKCSLSQHLNIHNNENPFKCNVCLKSFSQKSKLSRHSNTHKDEKPFKCNVCSKSFSQKSHLSEHIYIRKGENPF